MNPKNGSENYRIVPGKSFIQSFKQIAKDHYSKCKADLDRLSEELAEFEVQLSKNPCSVGKPEKFPPKGHIQGIELRKIRFKMPGLRGSSSKGRLIYIINKKEKTVHLLDLYTHKEYSTRPDDNRLRHGIQEAIEMNPP
jgi:mRNA-degrading endonuclease RelE of RelBE toxin-antitoxin system